MFRKITLSLFFSALWLVSYSQNIDSVILVKAHWQKTKLAGKVRLFQHHFTDSTLFKANQNISYLEIKQRGPANIIFAYEPEKLMKTSDFAVKNKALAAINGTFFDVKNGGSVDYLKVNSKLIHINRLGKNGERAPHQKAALTIKNGKLEIIKWDSDPKWEETLQAENVMQSGPLLRLNNQDEVLDTVDFNRLRHPRTCIGVKANGKIILLTIDGRNEQSAGASLFELSKIMKWLGCVDAINLDGGGSTTLWTDREGVINYPSDNKKWDHQGERGVANVILIKRNK